MLSGDKVTLGWGCSDCRGADFGEQDHLREARNCSGATAGEHIGFSWAPSLRRCPWSAITAPAWEAFGLWREWKATGVLPRRGDLGDQVGPIYSALRACETVLIEKQNAVTENG